MKLAQLEALEELRAISLRHGRFNVALVASVLINSHRTADSEPVSPFDFLAGYETDPEDAEKEKLRTSIKNGIRIAFARMSDKTREQILAERDAMVRRMTTNGVEDPEGLIREVYPDLGDYGGH